MTKSIAAAFRELARERQSSRSGSDGKMVQPAVRQPAVAAGRTAATGKKRRRRRQIIGGELGEFPEIAQHFFATGRFSRSELGEKIARNGVSS